MQIALTRAHRALIALVLVAAALATAGHNARATERRRAPLADLRLVNYYPATHGWTAMWTSWDAAEFDRDMGRAADLGANTVRLIVQPSAFGYPQPTSTMTNRLASAVAIADQHGLSTELTLFDWFSSYGDTAGSKAWAASLLAPYRDDTRIAAVELQNELPVENGTAVSWARALLPHLASLTSAPTTVSVNGSPARLAALKTALGNAQPAFWSYHYYDQSLGAGANSSFATVKAMAAPLPVFIGETGVDTTPRVGEDVTAAFDRQDHFFRAVFLAARAQGLPMPAPWTLTDFTASGVPGKANPSELAFGLLQTDGTPKPAAQTVHDAFTGAPLSTAFNGSFEQSSSALPAEWSLYLPTAVTTLVDRATAHSGSASVRLSGSAGDATGWPSLRTPVVQPVEPNRVYTATVWVKGLDVTGTNRLGITWYDSMGRYLGVSPSASVPAGTSDWRQLTATGAAPAGTAAALVQLQTTRNSGSVWFDDVTFA